MAKDDRFGELSILAKCNSLEQAKEELEDWTCCSNLSNFEIVNVVYKHENN